MKYLALAGTALVASHYGYETLGIDSRRAWEPRRIFNGVRTGQLTWREYRYLEREQGRIAQDERRAKADGYVSPYERYRLNRGASRDNLPPEAQRPHGLVALVVSDLTRSLY